MKRLLSALLLLAAPAAVLAGPYDPPYAIITTDTAPSSAPNRRPAMKNRAVVAPGKRMVTVDLPPRKGFSLGTQETCELEASPCMRYHVAARLDSQTGQHWKAVVRSSETIGECLTKFKGGTAAK